MTLGEPLFDALALGLREGVIEAICPKCGEDIETHSPSKSVCGGHLIDIESVLFRSKSPRLQ